ncbi:MULTISPECIES: transcriptional regulator SlyA [Vibrio]|jgi:MarR family transcriptional regulator for hemolysin|uniref:Transcriptional regulator SlyA n=4 Tax=Vibrionaceae TaxID=641 RepID=A0A7Y4F0H4_VIBAL|nr:MULTISPECIES: transcriptional regulator SlyA [Vibrio]MDG2627873.1 transcriptional regulator SlyA [Vibrio parahaemolyticus]MDW2257313.1 transcriptional regulator SlyA [Vibrio sp. 1409]ALR94514.1 MarR family transcriptional regulator [Vibrio alginolyticus]ANP66820.1 MarR family transcriptional regulator [Vibrio alginolyticus]AVF63595.1 transcriptional regulator SlyA [Vibrio alginolyticus]
MIQDINSLRDLSLAEKLSRVARLWKMVADRELEPLNLTYPRWTALWKLYRMGDNISQKHLAEALEIELASLMRTLKLLEEQSLIVRHCCEHDKRARIVSLTEEGKTLLKQMEARILQVRSKLLTDINDQELQQLSLILDQIAHNALDSLSE